MDAEYAQFQVMAPEAKSWMNGAMKEMSDRVFDPPWTRFLLVQDLADARKAAGRLSRALRAVNEALDEWISDERCKMEADAAVMKQVVDQMAAATELLAKVKLTAGWRGEGASSYDKFARNNIEQLMVVSSKAITAKSGVDSAIWACEDGLAEITEIIDEASTAIEDAHHGVFDYWWPYDWIAPMDPASDILEALPERITQKRTNVRQSVVTHTAPFGDMEEAVWAARKAIITPASGVWDR